LTGSDFAMATTPDPDPLASRAASRAPIPTLRSYYPSDAERQRFVTALFDRGAPFYDRVTDWMSLGMGRGYRRRALERTGLRSGMRLLDVATGTGQMAAAALGIVGRTGRVVGLDPSPGMVREMRRRITVPIVQSLGQELPFRDAQFDVVSMGYALRHLPDLGLAFEEYRRVLKPGGRVLILEISRPTSRPGLRLTRWYFRDFVPWATRRLTSSRDAELMIRYYWDTIAACVPPEVIMSALRAAGFHDVARRAEVGIFSAYVGLKT
jgi:demethylmenaquinone methyltransferase / 2-methoxy-6-polyprenyl-1,4-benzoquinol methylase